MAVHSLGSRFRLALVQLSVHTDRLVNVQNALTQVAKAAAGGAQMVLLPECFNCPYGTQFFEKYSEPIPGETSQALSSAAKQHKIYLVGGSIPERRDGRLYNTCTVFNPEGELILKYSKTHLFDIDIPGKIKFKESDVLTKGEGFGMFDVGSCRVGVGICYDIRFPELASLLVAKGCKVLLYPGAFNMTTGPAHWSLLQRARALDNQVYVATASPARDTSAPYVAWAHSSLVSPWAEVKAEAGESQEVIYGDIDLESVKQVRQQIPISQQKREDLYYVTR